MTRGLLLLAAGSGVGFLTGLFGVGGGFVIIPVLTLLMQLPTSTGAWPPPSRSPP